MASVYLFGAPVGRTSRFKGWGGKKQPPPLILRPANLNGSLNTGPRARIKARGGRGGPCRTGGGGRAGGRPEAEGPQRPARPPTAPGPRGPAKPAAALARPPARPVNTGPREQINRQGGPRAALPDGREREAEGPQRPARPPTAPGPLGPAKPAAALARPMARRVNTGPRARINRQGGARGALPDGREREGGGKAGGRGPAAPRPAPDSAGAARAG